jgi:hypothetical protein
VQTNWRGIVKVMLGKPGGRGDVVINDGMDLLVPTTLRDVSLQLITEVVPFIIGAA